jgi:hypothetical protein
MQNRLDFILKQNDFNRLPEEAAQAMDNVIDSLKRMK